MSIILETQVVLHVIRAKQESFFSVMFKKYPTNSDSAKVFRITLTILDIYSYEMK